MQVHVQVVPKNLVPEIIIAIEMDSQNPDFMSKFHRPGAHIFPPTQAVKVREDVRWILIQILRQNQPRSFVMAITISEIKFFGDTLYVCMYVFMYLCMLFML